MPKKKIKAFEFRVGWGSCEDAVNNVNRFVSDLYENGVTNIDINITSTGHGVVYTVIWEE